MKWLLHIFLAFLPLLVSGQAVTPVSYWLFNGTWDDTLNVNDLVAKNGAALSATFKVEGSKSGAFITSYDWAKTTNKVDLSSGEFTISFNVHVLSLTGIRIIMSNRVGNLGLTLQIDNVNGRLQALMYDGADGNSAYSANGSIEDDTWYHVCYRSFNTDAQYGTFWINGVLSGTDSTGQTNSGANDTLTFGTSDAGSYYLAGYLDNVSYYDEALSASQIDSLYDNRASYFILGNASTPALAGGTIASSQTINSGADVAAFTSSAAASGGTPAYTYTWQYSTTSYTAGSGSWTNIGSSNSATYDYGTLTQTTYFVRKVMDALNEVAYSNVLTVTVNNVDLEAHYRFQNNWNDETNNHDGTAKNGATFSGTYFTEGDSGAAFTSGNARMITQNKVDLSSGGVTIAFSFFKGSTTGTTWMLFENRTPGTRPGISCHYNGAVDNNRIVVEMDNGASQAAAYSPVNSITEGQWNHVVLRWMDITQDEVGIWINGSRANQTDSLGLAGANLNDTISIGATRAGAYTCFGYIDNFQVYKTALSNAQITDLYNHRNEDYAIGASGGPIPFAEMEVRPIDTYYQSDQELIFIDTKYSSNSYLRLIDVMYGTPYDDPDPPDPPSTLVGYGTIMGPEDYDGVCPTGEDRYTDADCASINFTLASARKIKDEDDYASIKYIDPTSTAYPESGTLTNPYNSWDDFSYVANTAYLWKRGTTMYLSAKETVTASNVLFGAYGTGEKPKIIQSTVNDIFVLSYADNCTFRDLYLSIPNGWAEGSAPTRTSHACIELIGRINTDVYNCEIAYAPYACWMASSTLTPLWNESIRMINNHIHHINGDGAFLMADYIEIGWNNVHDVNEYYKVYPYIHNDLDGDGVLESNGDLGNEINIGATGDGFELQFWTECYIHHNIIDHASAPNKATLMMHPEDYSDRLIIEFNLLVSPKTNSNQWLSGSTQLLNGYGNSLTFQHNLVFNAPGATRTSGLWSTDANDSIVGNVFVGFVDAIYVNPSAPNSVIVNNTFYNNLYCMRAGSAKTISKFQNNITWNNTSVLNNVSATVMTNNMASDPGYINASGNPYINDFKVQAGSTAINGGTLFASRKYDIKGTSVPQSTTDIGAYESEEAPPSESYFDLYVDQDFNNNTLGNYLNAEYRADWNQPDPTSFSTYENPTMEQEADPDYDKFMRGYFPIGTYSAAYGWNWYKIFSPGYTELWMSYDVRFKSGFDWVIGGKIPSIAMVNTMSGLPADETQGGSARIMWKEDGQLVGYVTHQDKYGLFGDTWFWNTDSVDTTPYAIVSGQWYNLSVRVVRNTIGQHNGILEYFVDGVKKFGRYNIEWVADPSLYWTHLYISAFFGGSTIDWATTRNEEIDTDNYVSWTYTSTAPNVPRGFQVHPWSKKVLHPKRTF